MSETIGIVGLGDLGGRLTLQAESAGFEVIAHEINQPKTPVKAVDPAVVITGLKWLPEMAESTQEVMQNAQTVHWCAPLEALPVVAKIPHGTRLILHNSIMVSSANARENLHATHSNDADIGIAHLLMNDERRAVVADNFGNGPETVLHFEKLGLSPLVMRHEEHDRVMAQSQGIFALLLNVGLREKMDYWNDLGLLAPSAHEVYAAVKHRELEWTPATLAAILGNPALKQFAQQLANDLPGEE